MEIIASKPFILLILATSSLLTSNVFCTDDLMLPSLHSKENDDKYSEVRGDPKAEEERSFNFEELKDWEPKYVKMTTPAPHKTPHSVINLPLRFGRNMEERRPGPVNNLPLRFGRNMRGSILRGVSNLPQRFGRMTAAKSVRKTMSDLFPWSVGSPPASELLYSMACQPLEVQDPEQKYPRRLGFKKIDAAELKQEK
ncbi:PREDICTED: pro-FMRFamide-related neuropeptide VF [Elephantulus edwardii]|uniref:pro-FMRFamide-related neuropeptide VF n=1 Tax=Elephantulus edwardii TaxID=28737 RepID=UPI0003F0A60F|nr:PREDICTED: pro-FMRFamide-related neuropeptide VF [Elephantulus edwardii]